MPSKISRNKGLVTKIRSGQLFGDLEPPERTSNRKRRSATANRQEVLNVVVAQLLEERGLVAAPEQIISRLDLRSRRMPDVLVDFQGLRLAIESEYAARGAEDKASRAALRRVSEGIAHVGMALIYPDALRTAPGDSETLRHLLTTETLQYAVITESEAALQIALPFVSGKESVIPFVKGTLDQVADALRRAYDQLIQDDVLNRAVRLLEQGIESFTFSLSPQPAATGRFMNALGIKELLKPKKEKTL
jgi:hypothetical protein